MTKKPDWGWHLISQEPVGSWLIRGLWRRVSPIGPSEINEPLLGILLPIGPLDLLFGDRPPPLNVPR